jgi:hypothetical protein
VVSLVLGPATKFVTGYRAHTTNDNRLIIVIEDQTGPQKPHQYNPPLTNDTQTACPVEKMGIYHVL